MEEYTMDGYKVKSLQFGTLALMSTSGKDAEHVYRFYQSQDITFRDKVAGSITRLAAAFQIAACEVGAAV